MVVVVVVMMAVVAVVAVVVVVQGVDGKKDEVGDVGRYQAMEKERTRNGSKTDQQKKEKALSKPNLPHRPSNTPQST